MQFTRKQLARIIIENGARLERSGFAWHIARVTKDASYECMLSLTAPTPGSENDATTQEAIEQVLLDCETIDKLSFIPLRFNDEPLIYRDNHGYYTEVSLLDGHGAHPLAIKQARILDGRDEMLETACQIIGRSYSSLNGAALILSGYLLSAPVDLERSLFAVLDALDALGNKGFADEVRNTYNLEKQSLKNQVRRVAKTKKTKGK